MSGWFADKLGPAPKLGQRVPFGDVPPEQQAGQRPAASPQQAQRTAAPSPQAAAPRAAPPPKPEPDKKKKKGWF
jgi:hypothetical protein